MVGYAYGEQSGGGAGTIHLSCGERWKRTHWQVCGDTVMLNKYYHRKPFYGDSIYSITLLVYFVRLV